jgi:hypothetical protein
MLCDITKTICRSSKFIFPAISCNGTKLHASHTKTKQFNKTGKGVHRISNSAIRRLLSLLINGYNEIQISESFPYRTSTVYVKKFVESMEKSHVNEATLSAWQKIENIVNGSLPHRIKQYL